MDSQNVPGLDLGVEELESMEAPGFWEWAAGIGTGVVVGGAIIFFT